MFPLNYGRIARNHTMEDCIQENVCLDIFLTFPTSNHLARFVSESTFMMRVVKDENVLPLPENVRELVG